ncbi:MAG: hypothetical protein MJ252_03460 [archaeon]|nr:hypothetical protein [archaeon]
MNNGFSNEDKNKLWKASICLNQMENLAQFGNQLESFSNDVIKKNRYVSNLYSLWLNDFSKDSKESIKKESFMKYNYFNPKKYPQQNNQSFQPFEFKDISPNNILKSFEGNLFQRENGKRAIEGEDQFMNSFDFENKQQSVDTNTKNYFNKMTTIKELPSQEDQDSFSSIFQRDKENYHKSGKDTEYQQLKIKGGIHSFDGSQFSFAKMSNFKDQRKDNQMGYNNILNDNSNNNDFNSLSGIDNKFNISNQSLNQLNQNTNTSNNTPKFNNDDSSIINNKSNSNFISNSSSFGIVPPPKLEGETQNMNITGDFGNNALNEQFGRNEEENQKEITNNKGEEINNQNNIQNPMNNQMNQNNINQGGSQKEFREIKDDIINDNSQNVQNIPEEISQPNQSIQNNKEISDSARNDLINEELEGKGILNIDNNTNQNKNIPQTEPKLKTNKTPSYFAQNNFIKNQKGLNSPSQNLEIQQKTESKILKKNKSPFNSNSVINDGNKFHSEHKQKQFPKSIVNSTEEKENPQFENKNHFCQSNEKSSNALFGKNSIWNDKSDNSSNNKITEIEKIGINQNGNKLSNIQPSSNDDFIDRNSMQDTSFVKLSIEKKEDSDQYEISDGSICSNEDIEDNNVVTCLKKKIPEWANDEATIKEECKKMSLNQNEVNNFFGNFVVSNLNLNMIFENSNINYMNRTSTADWRRDSTIAQKNQERRNNLETIEEYLSPGGSPLFKDTKKKLNF